MDPTFLAFMIVMAGALVLAMLLPLAGPAKAPKPMEADEKKDISPEPDPFFASPPRHPHALAPHELRPGEKVHILTRSGSRYRFTRLEDGERLFRMEGESASSGKRFVRTIFLRGEFVPGKPVMFFSDDLSGQGIISPIERLLVERARAAA